MPYPQQPNPDARYPMEGVVVLEPAHMIAAPWAATLLAEFGAEVIKLEMPGSGDPMRKVPPVHDGISLWWKVVGRNKKSITCDLRGPRGRDIFKRLVEGADVVIENFRPGVMEKWGLGWEDLRAVNPKLIMVRGSGFGQTGPYAARPAFGLNVEAFGGIPNALGYAGTPPAYTGLGDPIAGLMMAYGLMFALYHRDAHDGPGQYVDNSAAEAILRLVGDNAIPYAGLGLPEREKSSVDMPSRGGQFGEFRCIGVFPNSDGKWVAFTPSTRQIWDRFMKALGREDFLDEASYPRGSKEREERAEEVHSFVREWFASRTRDEVVRLMEQYEVPVGPVNSMADILRDSQLEARRAIIEVPDPDFGTLKMVNAVPRLSETPGEVRHSAPQVGEHNDEIYRVRLGMSSDEIEALKAEGII